MLLAWDGKVLSETKEARGVAYDIEIIKVTDQFWVSS